MNVTDLTSMSPDDFRHFIQKAAPGELEAIMPHLTDEQIVMVIHAIDTEKDSRWRHKIRSAILGLNQRSQLEAAASVLSIEQVAELIDKTLQVEDKHHWKLSPILVGMKFEVFQQLLEQTTGQELQVLQHEGVTEPVQHQLTRLGHELDHQIESIEKEIEALDEEIENIDPEALSREDVLDLQHRFGIYSEFFERRFQLANKALAIAWNTNRLDLIESLNKIKDSCQKYNKYGIGLPHKDGEPSTGLYGRLDHKLFSVYGDNDDLFDREGLQDGEPAIEALAKFSVWYLRDYWELGILPHVKREEELDLDLSKHSEAERAIYQEKLFTDAKENLKFLGFSTVADLKESYIFSKKTLREFIQANLDRLQNKEPI